MPLGGQEVVLAVLVTEGTGGGWGEGGWGSGRVVAVEGGGLGGGLGGVIGEQRSFSSKCL